jgi:predicted GH43/DUF377 family glycosyl hydrolase
MTDHTITAAPATLAEPLADDSDGLLRRDPGNPIITVRDLPHTAAGVYNPGAVAFRGETLLLVRVEDRSGLSHLAIARSADGVSGWTLEEHPQLMAQLDRPEEEHGLEDPRVTYLEELDRYAITYTAYSERGPLVSMMLTSDFDHFERLGPILPPENKDSALFPVRVDGDWLLINRPSTRVPEERADIWLASSPDLHHWGDHRRLIAARRGAWWDADHIGIAAPPLRTEEGWLLLYHAARHGPRGTYYVAGLALLDRDAPDTILARSSEWVLGPRAPYEETVHGGIVFPCGWIADGDRLRIYYGAADRTVALVHGTVSGLLQWLHRHQAGTGDDA